MTTQVKLELSLLTPSLAVATSLMVPEAVGVPLITPVAGLMDRPGGSPLALYVRASPFGSDAESERLVAVPASPAWLPGLTIRGHRPRWSLPLERTTGACLRPWWMPE